MKANLMIGVRLTDPMRGDDYSVQIEIAPPYVNAFERVDAVDDPLMRLCVPNSKMESEMRIVTKMRQDLATDLAKRLTEMLLDAMSARDTKNGYPKE